MTGVQTCALPIFESEAYTAINAVTANVAVVNTNLTAHVASTSAHAAANMVNGALYVCLCHIARRRINNIGCRMCRS